MEALPFGSTSILADPLVWFDENWMFVGHVAAFGVLLLKLRRLPPNSMAMWGYLSAWVYSLHQLEEHGGGPRPLPRISSVFSSFSITLGHYSGRYLCCDIGTDTNN